MMKIKCLPPNLQHLMVFFSNADKLSSIFDELLSMCFSISLRKILSVQPTSLNGQSRGSRGQISRCPFMSLLLMFVSPHSLGYSSGYMQVSMELGPEDVYLLERCPHFRGWYMLERCHILHSIAIAKYTHVPHNSPGSTSDKHCPLLSSPNDTGRDGLTRPRTSSHSSSSSSSRLHACKQESNSRTMFTVLPGAVHVSIYTCTCTMYVHCAGLIHVHVHV